MKALIQRVKKAKVTVSGELVSEIGPGILTFLGVSHLDTMDDVKWIIEKVSKLRIFEDDQGKMNLSLLDLKQDHLIVSQFTLYGDCEKGNRPSFISAAKPDVAKELYEKAIQHSQQLGLNTKGGRFQAHMNVEIDNDGPVTFLIESPQKTTSHKGF